MSANPPLVDLRSGHIYEWRTGSGGTGYMHGPDEGFVWNRAHLERYGRIVELSTLDPAETLRLRQLPGNGG